MTSSDEEKEPTKTGKRGEVISKAYGYIALLQSAMLAKTDEVETEIFLRLIEFPAYDVTDQLASLILEAQRRRRSYRVLMKLAHRYIRDDQEMPPQLREWLLAHLRGEHSIPQGGVRGPNKADMKLYWLKWFVDRLASETGWPVYPVETGDRDRQLLVCVAEASSNYKSNNGKSPYPTDPYALKRRYLEAKNWWEHGLTKVELKK